MEITENAASLLSNTTAYIGILIKHCILRIRPSFFSPITLGVQRTTRPPAFLIDVIISFSPNSNVSFGVPLRFGVTQCHTSLIPI